MRAGQTKYTTMSGTAELKAAIVEKAAMGGVCLNLGCIPTKALIESGYRIDSSVASQRFDMFMSFGGTKNGMMYGEAILFFDKTLG